MPVNGHPPQSPERIKLGKGIRELLALTDSLGLAYVGIHLCNALEILESEVSLPYDAGASLSASRTPQGGPTLNH